MTEGERDTIIGSIIMKVTFLGCAFTCCFVAGDWRILFAWLAVSVWWRLDGWFDKNA